MKEKSLILNLKDISIKDIPFTGVNNAYLGEMVHYLKGSNLNTPQGFIISTKAFNDFIEHNLLDNFIENVISDFRCGEIDEINECGKIIRDKIAHGEFPYHIKKGIQEAYTALSLSTKTNVPVVLTVSFTYCKHLENKRIANISGVNELLAAVKSCFQSAYNDTYLVEEKDLHDIFINQNVAISVQEMVNLENSVHGFAFSKDLKTGFNNAIIINGSLGFNVDEDFLSSSFSDTYTVYKPNLKKKLDAIIEKTKNTDNTAKFCLNDSQITEIAGFLMKIEKNLNKQQEQQNPVVIEWGVNLATQQIFVYQVNIIKNDNHFTHQKFVSYSIDENQTKEILLKGIAIGDKIISGNAKIVLLDNKNVDFNKGDILVAYKTHKDLEPLMKMASAIITVNGGRNSHAATFSQKNGIPAIVACQNALEILANNQTVTVSTAEGDVGLVYKNILKITKKEVDLDNLSATITPVMLNVNTPEEAFKYANLMPNGIGLARVESIIKNSIQIHPLALLNTKAVSNVAVQQQINHLIKEYPSGEDYFITKLSWGIAKIAASCYPKPVTIRFSDLKSNEYASLIGGEFFELAEENPLIGWRGASRYYAEKYKEAFALECKAIKRVRENFGFDNVNVLIPFCRTVDELLKVYSVMEAYGLKRKKNGLNVHLMAELPANFMMADEFAKHVDGFSVGSNDLTQLVLGLDRDASQVAYLYDERNSAIKKMIRMLLDATEDTDVKIGICGQGASNFPEFAQFLVKEGMDNISVNPESFSQTVDAIAEVEKKYIKKSFAVAHSMSSFRLK